MLEGRQKLTGALFAILTVSPFANPVSQSLLNDSARRLIIHSQQVSQHPVQFLSGTAQQIWWPKAKIY